MEKHLGRTYMHAGKKRIESNFEYLRKLFIMPDSPDKFIEFGRELLDMIHDFFQEKAGIHSSVTLPQLSGIFDQKAIPESPMLIKDVLSEIKTKIIDNSVKVGSPCYIGHMTSAIPYFMILLEMIIAALNQNQVKIETAKASSFVERELLAWLHRLIFNRRDSFYERHIHNPRVALGNVTSDGTIGNLTALFVAREKAFPPDERFPGARAAGMVEALRHYGFERAVVLVSTRGHYSIRKAANILGIGEENVITISVDSANRMDLRKLRKKIRSLGSGPHSRIIAIVGIAGTTETGNIDRLDAMEEIAHEAGGHFHVDASWGGPALLAEEYRGLFKGIEKADSVTIDAHKLLYCPMSMGMVLFRSEKDLNAIKHSSQYIIRRNSVDTGRFTIEGSRPFACLKPWASLKIIGRDGYGLLFRQAKRNTDIFKKILENYRSFECLNHPELFILTYRFMPVDVKERLHCWSREATTSCDKERRKDLEKGIARVNRLMNAFTVKLHKALRRDDSTFVSRTTLESTRYSPQNIVVLRAVLINPLTTGDYLEEIAATQNRIALQLWQDFAPAYGRMAEEVGGSIPSTSELPGANAAHLL